ncbi:MAG: hypothetical protein V4753_11205 [Pseudomonadota bacterium]
MALISCSECGKEVSDKATNCIGCGAPIEKQQGVGVLQAPTKVTFDPKTGEFSGTKQLLSRLAVKAVVDIGWRVDSSDETTGLVSFTTGMTWGSFSGVSGTIVVEERDTGWFSVSGTAKQNIRGGQLIAPNLFNEANKKVAKVVERMKQISQI